MFARVTCDTGLVPVLVASSLVAVVVIGLGAAFSDK